MKPGSGVPRGGHQLERELLAFLNPSQKKKVPEMAILT